MKKYLLLLTSTAFAFWFSVAPQLPEYCVASEQPGQFTKHFVTDAASGGVEPYLVPNELEGNRLEASLGQKKACTVAAYKF